MSDDEDFFSDSDSEHDDQDLAPIPSSPTTEEETPTSATIHSAKQPLTLKERKKLQKQKQQKTGETIDENENESLQQALEQQALIEKVSKSIMYYHLTEHGNRIVSVDSLHPSWSTRIRRNMLNQLKKFHGTRTIFNKDGTTTTTRTPTTATTEATPTATETKNEGKNHNDKKTNNEDLRNSGKSSGGSDRVRNHQNRIEKVHTMSQNLRQGSKQWNNNNSNTKTDRNTNNDNRTSATEKKSFANNQKNTQATATTITTTATKATPEVFVHPSIIEKRKQRDMLGSTNWSGKKIVFGKPKSSTTSASEQS